MEMVSIPSALPAREPSPLLARAVTALRSGGVAEAERILRGHLVTSPRDPEALAKLAEVVALQGRQGESVHLLLRLLALAPEAHEARLTLARLLLQQGDPHSALVHVRELPAAMRSTFDVAAFEAAVLGILGDHAPEIAIYEQLVVERPAHAELWNSYGNALKYAGRAGEALVAFRKALKLRPGYGEGWWSLANLKSARFDERDLAAMRKALAAKPPAVDALHLHFALGKALGERKQYAQSFAHFDAGNRIRASQFAPGVMSARHAIDEQLALFDAELVSRIGTVGHRSDEPIFVVGLQRSGSTLVEQILASHPAIEGTSELLAMQQLWHACVQDAARHGHSLREHILAMSPAEFAKIGAEYLERTRPFRHTGKPRFVDKLPANWMQTGFIRLVLPNARIVDARRHPMACGFSNFTQHYATGVAFAYSQQSIGQFYQDYLRLMGHFQVVQPGAVHLAVNEALIEDTEAEVRRLLDFVGVPFDPACLAFHSNRRSVNTPSAEQVRRPINRDGMEHWRHYEEWLGPLKDALGPALDDWR